MSIHLYVLSVVIFYLAIIIYCLLECNVYWFRRKKKEEVMGVRKNNLEIAKENSLFNQNRLSNF
jgi:hypothetical protein